MFREGRWSATNDASKFFLTLGFWGALMITLHVNEWFGFWYRCLAGSDFPLGSLCSFHLTCTFLFVSPIYDSPQLHCPSYNLQDGCGFLLFKLKRFLIFLVFHFMTTAHYGHKRFKLLNKVLRKSFIFRAVGDFYEDEGCWFSKK